MPRPKATDALSEDAKRVMLQGFAQHRTAAWIADAIHDATGEEVATRTIARRAAEWRAELARRTSARERMQDLVQAMKAGNMDASEMIQALAMDRLVDDPDALTGADPIKVQGLSLAAKEIRLKKRQLDIRERQVIIGERKLHLLEERDQRARAALEDKGETMTAEERVQRIREIKLLYSRFGQLLASVCRSAFPATTTDNARPPRARPRARRRRPPRAPCRLDSPPTD
jgi:hypothetical protein